MPESPEQKVSESDFSEEFMERMRQEIVRRHDANGSLRERLAGVNARNTRELVQSSIHRFELFGGTDRLVEAATDLMELVMKTEALARTGGASHQPRSPKGARA